MILFISRILRYRILVLLFGLLTLMSCRKEAALQASGEDENYLIVQDNPGNETDHAIYQFYRSTGIPVFYNDTIGRKQVGKNPAQPDYFYIKLGVAYSPGGFNSLLGYSLPVNKTNIIPMIDLLKERLLPILPTDLFIPSILLVDSLSTTISYYNTIALPILAYYGFNTVAIKMVATDTMNENQVKKYVTSLAATIAVKEITARSQRELINNFYNISNMASPIGNAYGLNILSLSPDGSQVPEDFGFLTYYTDSGNIFTLNQPDDLTSYLDAAFYYNTASFNSTYSGYPIVLQKFQLAKTLATQVGFQFQ